MDTYSGIFGGREVLDVPGETVIGGVVEAHSIFGSEVMSADAEIDAAIPPSRGPVDATPIPITATGPSGIGPSEPIDDKVTYGSSVFEGLVRDVAGLGEYRPYRRGAVDGYVPMPRGGMGGYVPMARGGMGAMNLSANLAKLHQATTSGNTMLDVITGDVTQEDFDAQLAADQQAKDVDKKEKMYTYIAVGVGAVAILGGLWYYYKS